jgi:biotin transport system permease protein
MFAPFSPGTSLLHRLSPAPKLVALALAGTGLFWLDSAPLMALAVAFTLVLYRLSGLCLRHAREQLRPVALMMLLLIGAQVLFNDAASAPLVGGRIVALVLLAGLVSLTTRTSAMIETLECAMRPLLILGLEPRKPALVLALSLRLIPLLARIVEEVREAQRVRGLEHSLIALAVPVLIRALSLTDTFADAIDARGFDA